MDEVILLPLFELLKKSTKTKVTLSSLIFQKLLPVSIYNGSKLFKKNFKKILIIGIIISKIQHILTKGFCLKIDV